MAANDSDAPEKDDAELMAAPEGGDFEVLCSFHSDTQLERAFYKASHWVKVGVRPMRIFLEDQSMGVINFRKTMRDPILAEAGVERTVDFRCSLTLSDRDVDVVFSSVCYYEKGADPVYINAYDPELSSIKEVLNLVSQNLFNYLQKPLLSQG